MGNLLVLAAETTNLTVQWWITGIGVAIYFVLLFGVTSMTQAGVIARATTKEAIRQPVFLLLKKTDGRSYAFAESLLSSAGNTLPVLYSG